VAAIEETSLKEMRLIVLAHKRVNNFVTDGNVHQGGRAGFGRLAPCPKPALPSATKNSAPR
jgi:hypothetical protein